MQTKIAAQNWHSHRGGGHRGHRQPDAPVLRVREHREPVVQVRNHRCAGKN